MRITRNVLIGSIAAALVFVSCGGDDGLGDVTGSSDSIAASSDSGSTDTISPDDMLAAGDMLGLSDKCTEIYTSMINALGSMGTTDDSAKETFRVLGEEFAAIRDQVPDELKDDIDILAEGYAQYGALLDEYSNDPTAMGDADVLAKFNDILANEEFNNASNNFNTWLDTECSVGS